MEQVQRFSFPSSDGIHDVQVQEWRPEGAPRGVVQIVHGIAEHVGRYDVAARFLAAHGLLVRGGGKIRPLCDAAIVAPERETYKIQELHLPVYHALCLMLEEEFF